MGTSRSSKKRPSGKKPWLVSGIVALSLSLCAILATFILAVTFCPEHITPRFASAGTNAWILGKFSFAQNFSVAAQETSPHGHYLSPDGTRLFVVGIASDTVYQYNLGTAFDLSTASYSGNSHPVGAQDLNPTGLTMNPDGTQFYITGYSNGRVFQYDLGTPFDISTASYSGTNLVISGQEGTPYAITFSLDGTHFYMIGRGFDKAFQYDVSSPFDLATASYSGKSFAVGAQDNTPYGLAIRADGSSLYIGGAQTDTVYQYNLSTPYDVSTASLAGSLSVAAQDTDPISLHFKADGTTLFVLGFTSRQVYKYEAVDDVDPAVVTLDPSDDATDVPRASDLTVVFDEPVYVQSGNISIFRSDNSLFESIDVTSGQVTGTGSDTITVDLASDLENKTDYYVTIDATAFDDIASNSYVGIADSVSWNFSSIDDSAPKALTLDPADDMVSVPRDTNLTIVFDETIQVKSGNVNLFASDGSLVEAIDVNSSQVVGDGTDTITVNPANDLISSVEYYITIDPTAFDDASGNSYAGITDTTSWNFKAADIISNLSAITPSEQATIVSRYRFPAPGSADCAVIAREDLMIDAFVVGPLVTLENCTLLLTSPSEIEDAVMSELNRALSDSTKQIYIAGGQEALTPQVQQALYDASYVDIYRFNGSNRRHTARLIAYEVASRNPRSNQTVIVTEDTELVDALSITSVAGLVSDGIVEPIIINKRKDAEVDRDVQLFLEENSYISNVQVVGGPEALPEGFVTNLSSSFPDLSFERLAGADRYETNAAIINNYFKDPQAVYVALGDKESLIGNTSVAAATSSSLNEDNALFSALMAGTMAAANNSPLLLVSSSEIPTPIRQYVTDNAGTIGDVYLVSFSGTIQSTVQDEFRLLLE